MTLAQEISHRVARAPHIAPVRDPHLGFFGRPSDRGRRLTTPPDVLSPRMVHVIEDLAGDWRRLDERIEGLSGEIEAIARRDASCERLMSVPGIGPMISSAMVAAIGDGDAFGPPTYLRFELL